MLNSQILTISLSSINPRKMKNRTQHVKERLRPSNQNIVLILYQTFSFPASYLKKKKGFWDVRTRMRSRNLGAMARVRKTSSIYVRALQCSVPYHSRTPPKHTHTRTNTHIRTRTFLYSVCKSRRKIKEGELKQRLWRVQTYSREGRIAGQKDVEDKLGHQREL